MSWGGPHTVYSLWDASGELLYIGCTMRSVAGRVAAHRTKPWGDAIDNVTVEHVGGRYEALDREAQLIRERQPLHNVQGKVGRHVNQTTSVSTTLAMRQALHEAANRRGMNYSHYVRQVFADALDRDLPEWRAAEAS